MHFRRPRRSRGVGDVNITPLVDMVFNLIIFLLISTTFKTAERAFVIDLPTAGQEQVEVTEHSPVVFVKKSGDYFFLTTDDATQGEPEAVGLDVLKERLRALKAGREDAQVAIRGEKEASLQSIIGVIDAAYEVGLTKVELPYEMNRNDGAGQ